MQSKMYDDLGEHSTSEVEAMLREFEPGNYIPVVMKDFEGKYRACYVWICPCHEVFQAVILEKQFDTIDEAYVTAEWIVKKNTGNLDKHGMH